MIMYMPLLPSSHAPSHIVLPCYLYMYCMTMVVFTIPSSRQRGCPPQVTIDEGQIDQESSVHLNLRVSQYVGRRLIMSTSATHSVHPTSRLTRYSPLYFLGRGISSDRVSRRGLNTHGVHKQDTTILIGSGIWTPIEDARIRLRKGMMLIVVCVFEIYIPITSSFF